MHSFLVVLCSGFAFFWFNHQTFVAALSYPASPARVRTRSPPSHHKDGLPWHGLVRTFTYKCQHEFIFMLSFRIFSPLGTGRKKDGPSPQFHSLFSSADFMLFLVAAAPLLFLTSPLPLLFPSAKTSLSLFATQRRGEERGDAKGCVGATMGVCCCCCCCSSSSSSSSSSRSAIEAMK